MVTLLEVIDSAVKIGLGALIAGIASYLVTWRNHTHDRASKSIEERRKLGLELATALEKVESSYNELALHFDHDDVVRARKALIPAAREAYTARALSNLLGSDDLVAAVDEIAKLVEKLYAELSNDSPDVESLRNIGTALAETKKAAYPHIRRAYRSDT